MMKKIALIGSILISMNATAYECVSEDNPDKLISVETIHGENYSKLAVVKVKNVKEDGFQLVMTGEKFFQRAHPATGYKLFDQTGKNYVLEIHETFSFPTCRTRVCHAPDVFSKKKVKLVNLELNENEYFNCL